MVFQGSARTVSAVMELGTRCMTSHVTTGKGRRPATCRGRAEDQDAVLPASAWGGPGQPEEVVSSLHEGRRVAEGEAHGCGTVRRAGQPGVSRAVTLPPARRPDPPMKQAGMWRPTTWQGGQR